MQDEPGARVRFSHKMSARAVLPGWSVSETSPPWRCASRMENRTWERSHLRAGGRGDPRIHCWTDRAM